MSHPFSPYTVASILFTCVGDTHLRQFTCPVSGEVLWAYAWDVELLRAPECVCSEWVARLRAGKMETPADMVVAPDWVHAV